MSSDTATPVTVTFAEGLVGLPDLQTFELRPLEGTVLFDLASADDPSIGFVLANADDVRSGLSDELRGRGLTGVAENLFVILAVHDGEVTANLAGPIAFDGSARTARQLVIEDPAHPLRAPVRLGEG